ncbi:unnamed protein product, partial [marine sediment metagenome]
FFLFPILYSFFISFHSWSTLSSPSYVGLENYRDIFFSSHLYFWNSMKNTVCYVGIVVPSVVVLALIVAVLVNMRTGLQNFFKVLYFMPVICSAIVVGIIWKWIYSGDIGVLNYFLDLFHLPTKVWLGDTQTALGAVAIVGIWQSVGYYMIIYLAGLQSIPSQLYEAAKVDGASEFQNFIFITLPMLRPIILLVLILTTIFAFQAFGVIYIMTYGGPVRSTNTVVWKIYISAFTNFNFGYAAAMAFTLFLVIFAISMVQLKYFKS